MNDEPITSISERYLADRIPVSNMRVRHAASFFRDLSRKYPISIDISHHSSSFKRTNQMFSTEADQENLKRVFDLRSDHIFLEVLTEYVERLASKERAKYKYLSYTLHRSILIDDCGYVSYTPGNTGRIIEIWRVHIHTIDNIKQFFSTITYPISASPEACVDWVLRKYDSRYRGLDVDDECVLEL
jgi:hypothetical protein